MIFEMGILSARKVGFLLAAVWIGTLAYIWLPDVISFAAKSLSKQEKINLALHSQVSFNLTTTWPHMTRQEGKDVVHVCITSDKNTLGGMMALIYSIVSNTHSHVAFHLVVDKASVNHARLWLQSGPLRNITFELVGFPNEWVEGKVKVRAGRRELASPMNYARYYLPKLFPKLDEKIVFIDDDCIVQGDISELYHSTIQTGHLAAFFQDCGVVNQNHGSKQQNIYSEFLDFKNPHVAKMRLSPSACAFNTGVFVAPLGAWRRLNLTQQLEHWMELNAREAVYGNERGGGGSQPPMMIVFHEKYTPLRDMAWHVRSLGAGPNTSATHDLNTATLTQAKLLHWNGKYKPWGRVSQHQALWRRYFLPDPTGRWRPDSMRG